jgi:hypothetical protein
LKERSFFVINPEHLSYYSNAALAGQKFKDNWPKANEELTEAGKCFALDRHTACACHLMRAIEYALRSFEDALGITSHHRNNWGDILGRIEEKQGRKGDSRTGHPSIPPIPASPEWDKNPDFYQGCYSYIAGIKASCRDRVFHVESAYNGEQADRLLQSVRSFLSFASDGLEETK